MATSDYENPVCQTFCRQENESPSQEQTDHYPVVVRIVIFFGICCTVTGIWECTQSIDPYLLEGGSIYYKIAGKLLLFSGSLLTIVSLVAISEALSLMRLGIFSLLQGLGVVLLFEGIAGSLAFVMSTAVSKGFLNRSLLHDLEWHYSKEERVTFAWDEIQRTFHCCGVTGPEDWEASYWYDNKDDEFNEYPRSCCDNKPPCTNATVNKKGCGETASKTLKSRLLKTHICAFSSIFIHVTTYMVLTFLERRV